MRGRGIVYFAANKSFMYWFQIVSGSSGTEFAKSLIQSNKACSLLKLLISKQVYIYEKDKFYAKLSQA